jgi:hypothetical protein
VLNTQLATALAVRRWGDATRAIEAGADPNFVLDVQESKLPLDASGVFKDNLEFNQYFKRSQYH